MVTSKCDVFISYRRLDSAIFSQWLADQLRAAYGPTCVFIDTENIRDADVWAARVQDALDQAAIVVIVIGKSWLSISDEVGRRRIDLTDDWVRREIEASIVQGKKVLPLLIDGADLPDRNALPESVGRLVDFQARRIATTNIAKDIADLVKAIGVELRKEPASVEVQYPFPLLKISALDEENLHRLNTRLPMWRVVSRPGDKAEKIEPVRKYEFESFSDVIHFMNSASRFIDRIDHHPEWTNIWRTLVVYLTTWDIGHKPSMLDVDLAAYLDDLYKNYQRTIGKSDVKLASEAS
ncbi:MAG TPA: 4a-hydroxytetrahydrobiopterin dehydratase [Xanthobacteraceae bacterium]|jgi:pterin-4a-carbinolamine dehydratase|nr:4a-hydroxytetrahydrobiopterin dehydratase [Xanthobacteraceae bacterium]